MSSIKRYSQEDLERFERIINASPPSRQEFYRRNSKLVEDNLEDLLRLDEEQKEFILNSNISIPLDGMDDMRDSFKNKKSLCSRNNTFSELSLLLDNFKAQKSVEYLKEWVGGVTSITLHPVWGYIGRLMGGLPDGLRSYFDSEDPNVRSFDKFKQLLRDKKSYPTLSRILNEATYELNEIDEANMACDELVRFFSYGDPINLEDFFVNQGEIDHRPLLVNEVLAIKSRMVQIDDIHHAKVEFNKSAIDDFITEIGDCLSIGKRGIIPSAVQTIYRNSYSGLLSVNLYLNQNLVGTIGRAVITMVQQQDERGLYVAGFSGSEKINDSDNWENVLSSSLCSLVDNNGLDFVFFDLNPQNQNDQFSHEWAKYIAKRTEMVEGFDYSFNKEKTGKGKGRPHIFKLTKEKEKELTWQNFKIMKDFLLDDKFFFEGASPGPKRTNQPFLADDYIFACGVKLSPSESEEYPGTYFQ